MSLVTDTIERNAARMGLEQGFWDLIEGIDDLAEDLSNLAVEYVDVPGPLSDEIQRAYYQAYHADFRSRSIDMRPGVVI
jgi:hypothetical protein